MKMFEVCVFPGEYFESGAAKNVSTGDMVKTVIHAHDQARAREQAIAMFGGPMRAQTGPIREIR